MDENFIKNNLMTHESLENLKYPIGRFHKPENTSTDMISSWISDVESLPESIEKLIRNLTIEELNLTYRPEGWKIKQVIHHCADSHMNAFIRFKLALTEDLPIIKPYHEDRWAELEDGKDDTITDSLNILKSLHTKWVKLLRTLTNEDLKRVYIHPEHGKRFELIEALGMYAWHCNHHLGHIKKALEYRGRFN